MTWVTCNQRGRKPSYLQYCTWYTLIHYTFSRFLSRVRLWHECYELLAKRRGLLDSYHGLGLRQPKPTQLPPEISTKQITQQRGFHSVPYFHPQFFGALCGENRGREEEEEEEEEASPVGRLSNGTLRWGLGPMKYGNGLFKQKFEFKVLGSCPPYPIPSPARARAR